MTQYWFRQKRFGYGATPNTWQGWLVTIAGLLAVAGVIWTANFVSDHAQRTLWLILGLALVLVPLLWVSYVKTEGGWRWRGGEN